MYSYHYNYLASIYLIYLYYKSPNKSKNAVYSVDDDDSLWIWGCIYNNPMIHHFLLIKDLVLDGQ